MHLPVEHVLVPLDLSDTARGALLVALSWASALRAEENRGTGVRLTALYADQSSRGRGTSALPQFKADLARARADAGGWAGVEIEGPELVSGDAATAIAQYATEHRVDLIVLGTRGLGLDAVGR